MNKYIDADELLMAFGEVRADYNCFNELERPRYEMWSNAIDFINTMAKSSIDIEPKRGEWILLEPRYPIEQKVYWNKEQALADTKGNGARERRKCSCCGYTKSFMCHMKDEQIKLWNFCPNCGADMRGKDDE